jgi:hypothetical protein
MKIDQKIINRFDELIGIGAGALASYQGSVSSTGTVWYRNTDLCIQWSLTSKNFVAGVFGNDHEICIEFTRFATSIIGEANSKQVFAKALSYLRSAKAIYIDGQLFNLRKVVTAEVFDDLLEQAEHILSEGYFIPAAVIAGSVLEDGLRQICSRDGVPIPLNATMNPMNDALTKHGTYTALTQKKILYLAALRNDSAHGKWVNLPPQQIQARKNDVEGMILDVRRFLADYL